jgi:hypothetical protein
MDSLDWTGTHTLRAKCTNGVYDENNDRGNNGLYESVYSADFDLVLENPCEVTPVDLSDPVYSVYSDAVTFTVQEFGITPAECTYTLTYQV